MIFQSTKYNCGPAAVVNACRVLGLKITEKQAARAAGTTAAEGTGVEGIQDALGEAGAIGLDFDCPDAMAACLQLNDRYLPAIICVHGWQHWVTVIAKTGNRYVVVDSEDTAKNRRHNGVYVLTWPQLKKMWSKRGVYSGLSVGYAGSYNGATRT